MVWAKLRRIKGRVLSAANVKVCGLCEALNHQQNTECFLCGWRGAFDADAARVSLAWRRLEDEYEEVRLEHVTSSRRGTVEELGAVARRSPVQEMHHRARQWWRGFLLARDRRAALRDAALRAHGVKHSAQ